MFTHLHLHTEYSLLDGMCKIEPLLTRCQELGMGSLAITDHGAMHGVVEFFLAAREQGIKPILGCEVYMAPQDLRSRNPSDKNPFHLLLLARNEEGYRNLIQLVTKANLEGFYYKPRVDKELLEHHKRGLIALSACANGEIARLLLEGRRAEAGQAALWYREVFGDFYLEVQEHGIAELASLNKELVSLGGQLGIPLVATNDVHYIQQRDAYAHQILLCIQTNTTIGDEKRMKLEGDSFYLKSPQEMASLFSELPEALENTKQIAEMCNLQLAFDRLHLPEVERPPGMTADDYLAHLCQEGLHRLYAEVSPQVQERLRYELEVIRSTQFANYFLVVWDIARFARERGILFGVRGSAAASIVLYCLGITEIDPLEHRLVFERFLNLERAEMPDIDMDFADDRRDEVIAYLTQRYGRERVAQIITFGTLGARAAIRDVGRALGMSYGEVDRAARLVPPALNVTLERALEESGELAYLYREDPRVRQLIDTAQQLEGIARHASTHAAGVVIAREPLTQYVPLQRPTKGSEEGTWTTQFPMDAVAQIGLLKMDVLGLSNLTILQRAKEAIAQRRAMEFDLQKIPLDDAKTFALLSAGETTGVFQLESAGMRRYIKELKPTCLGDLAAMIALYRPGPMQHVDTFIRAKQGVEPIHFPHPALAQILEETYGVIVYQDQVLFIVQAFAGYTLGQAEVFRKAMGKKIPEKMREERERFLEGAQSKGFPRKLAEEVFDLIEPFAGYAFNKAHSVSYALIAYQTAYLKANYPAEYMAAVLTTYADMPEKVASAIAECHRRLHIPVLPPDVNKSELNFAVEEVDSQPAIRFGLAAIKNLGASALSPMLEARRAGGAFSSVEDFCRRVDLRGLNRRALESLIKVGALDPLGIRETLLEQVERLLALSHQYQRLKETGQASMFDLWGEEVPTPLPNLELSPATASPRERLAWEKELLGVYLSEHPFSRAAKDLAQEVDLLCGQVSAELAGQPVVVAGMVASVRTLLTKKGRPFLVALLEDLDGSLEVTVWSELYEATQALWSEGNILLVRGRVRVRGDSVQIGCEEVWPYPLEGEVSLPISRASNERQLRITISESDDEEGDIEQLKQLFILLSRHPGRDTVELEVIRGEERERLVLPPAAYSPALHGELVGLLGESALTLM